jgi:hypothetical protein
MIQYYNHDDEGNNKCLTFKKKNERKMQFHSIVTQSIRPSKNTQPEMH